MNTKDETTIKLLSRFLMRTWCLDKMDITKWCYHIDRFSITKQTTPKTFAKHTLSLTDRAGLTMTYERENNELSNKQMHFGRDSN